MNERKTNKHIPVICLHDVAKKPLDKWCISTRHLRSLLNFIKINGYKTITATELSLMKDYHPKAVCITFDDALTGVYNYALEIFNDYNMTASVFVPSKHLGDRLTKHSTVCTTNQIQEISRHFEIGSHGHEHTDLRKKEQDLLIADILESKSQLQAITNKKITSFAYPVGKYNDFLKKAVMEAGFTIAFSVFIGRKNLSFERYAYDRLEISNTAYPLSYLEFLIKLSGRYLF